MITMAGCRLSHLCQNRRQPAYLSAVSRRVGSVSGEKGRPWRRPGGKKSLGYGQTVVESAPGLSGADAGIVNDPVAGNEVAAQNHNAQWSLQWPVPGKFLNPKVKYRLQAEVRLEKSAGTELVWKVGIYDRKGKKDLFQQSFSGSEQIGRAHV